MNRRAGSYDGFIGLGGGSAMDTAKAINLMLHSEGDIRRWRVPNSPSMRTLPLLCVPTTAGTGSEVTRGVVITDPATHEKIVFMGLACLPQAAIVDPDLTRELPFRIAADTGLDALTHAIEAYVSRKRNDHTDAMALNAMRLIGPNIIPACVSRDAVREADAGRHPRRHGVLQRFGSPGPRHEPAARLLLQDAARYVERRAAGRSHRLLHPRRARPLRRLLAAIGFADASDSDQAANDKLVQGLVGLARELKVPTLAEFGIDKGEYFGKNPGDDLAGHRQRQSNNNPRVATTDEIAGIYNRIWQ